VTSAATVLERCERLAGCTEEPGRVTRPYGTPALRCAIDLVAGWMREAALEVTVDAVGNLRGRRAGGRPDAPTLLLGSHLDSVRDAGRYDGPLGVLVALAAVADLGSAPLPFALEVVAFADEEGLRFRTHFLGSRVLAGTFDPADLELVDGEGTTLAEAIRAFGGDPAALPAAAWAGGPLLGYCVLHIVQGPTLERRGLPVGVVTALAGQTHAFLSLRGQAGHAGTVPMAGRHDALAAAAEVVLAVEAEARGHEGLVATVGKLEVEPGAVNVIPSRARLTLDVRHAQDAERLAAVQAMLARAAALARDRGVELAVEQRSDAGAVRCDPRLVATFAEAVGAAGVDVHRLVSGAGHDAVPMAGLTSVALLFVRCRGGLSHHPDEAVAEPDVAVAIDVLRRFLELLARRT
jgi:allantoate deiminase